MFYAFKPINQTKQLHVGNATGQFHTENCTPSKLHQTVMQYIAGGQWLKWPRLSVLRGVGNFTQKKGHLNQKFSTQYNSNKI